MAIADLIDNSIYAKAGKVVVDYDWNEGSPWFRVLDDGFGMSEEMLHEAMRLGSQSPLEMRDASDLGRFGLGLKTASFSQGKLLTVYTRTADGKAAIRSWDLDDVCRYERWNINTKAPEISQPFLGVLDEQVQGTVVLCQKLDRLARDSEEVDDDAPAAFLDAFRKVAAYLEMVFHRYLSDRKQLTIKIGRHICRPWDPFLTSNGFTQPLAVEYLDHHRIEVKPYVLPHVSKRTQIENERGGGLYGWNAHQGFYIYRNKRMIIPGGYLDLPFKAEDHYKLCRIRVDLPNDRDHEWNIDVRKAAASPPPNVRGDLERIARAARAQAQEVFRARAGGARHVTAANARQDVWLRKRRGEKVLYKINSDNEAIRKIVAQVNPPASWTRQLFHLIEKTVPHRLIIIDNAENEDCQVDLPPEFNPPPQELIDLCCQIFLERIKKRPDLHAAADFVCSVFDDHPAYRAALDNLIEEMG